MPPDKTTPRVETPRAGAPAAHRLPGDPSPAETVRRMIRVDHAGEFGAARIYDGQLAVLRPGPGRDAVTKMAEQEREHLARFDDLMIERRVRPTLFSPVWHAAGFALGAATAMMGERAAMACTVAVEDVIAEHYLKQSDALGEDEADLRATVDEFRADEIEHHDTGIAHGAEQAPGFELMSGAIRAGTKLAIWLSTRV
jgi:3-demethoxyubiquinol 3-hydroxylase